MTIGQLAKRADVRVETIRFTSGGPWCPSPPAHLQGYRLYPLETLDRLGFVRRAKGLGFSLTEIRDLLSVSVGRGCTADVRARAPEKIHDIDDKTRDLQRMRSRLFELLKSCPEEAPHKTARSWRLWWGGQN